jgi:hypothetical protein
MEVNKKNGQRIPKKPKPKMTSPYYKDGKAIPDEKPHELVLASFGEPDLQERVDELTRMSRIRRIRRNDALDDIAFEQDVDAELPDEGITPYEVDGADVSGREEPSPDFPPAEQNDDEVVAAEPQGEAVAEESQ